MRNTSLYILIFLFFAGIDGFCQGYNLLKFTTEDGLPSNSIYGAIQDKQGYIWIYTEKGVTKYNGHQFKTYTVKDGLPTNDIWGMLEDSAGRIWLQCYGKDACYYEKGQFKSFPIDGVGLIEIIEADSTVQLWTKSFVKSYETPAYQTDTTHIAARARPVIPGVEFGYLARPMPTKEGTFLVINDGQIEEYSRDNKLIRKKPTSLFDELNRFIKPHERCNIFYLDNHYYWAYSSGIVKFKPNFDNFDFKLLNFEEQGYINKNQSQVLLFDNKIQVSIDQGLLLIDKDLNIFEYFDSRFLTENGVLTNRKFKDRAGNIWICTTNNGLLMLPLQALNSKIYKPKNASGRISSLAMIEGQTYFGNDFGGLFKMDGEQIVTLINDGPVNNILREITVINDELIALSYEDELLLYNTKLGVRYALDAFIQNKELLDSFPLIANKSAYFDAPTQRLFITSSIGSSYIQFDQGKVIDYIRLSPDRSLDIIRDNLGRVWAAEPTGITCLNREEKSIENINFNYTPMSFAKRDDLLFIGTDGHGVFAYDGVNSKQIQGTEGEIISSILFSNDTILWTATNHGLIEIIVPDDIEKSYSNRVYTVKDGLGSDEILSIGTDKDHIFAGTINGLVKINRQRQIKSNYQAPLIIENIHVGENQYALKDNIVLSYDHEPLVLSYHLLSYNSIDYIEYSYQLKKTDKWVNGRPENLMLNRLSPCKYQLRLKAEDINGSEYISPPIHIHVQKPFWFRTWFVLLCTLGIAGIFYLIYRYRIKLIRQKQAEEFAIEKRFAEVEMQALQSQMNPHFVFNCLGSIQNFVLDNDTKKAVAYLGKFGQLMRLFLESSKNKFISLSEEIKLLDLYMELKKMRYDDDCEVSINCPQFVKNMDIHIPSMLIQPFVENAFIHGMSGNHVGRIKKVEINFEVDADKLKCLIIDNGIGRKNASQIQENSVIKHISRGTQIVNERLEVFREINGLDIQISLQNATVDADYPGTKVTIVFPL